MSEPLVDQPDGPDGQDGQDALNAKQSAHNPVIDCQGVAKRFSEGPQELEVLRRIDLRVERAEQLAVVGPSGSGKSTLLHILGGLDEPSSGTVQIAGESIYKLGQAARGRLRNRELGFVYQFHHLLPEFSALENVAMPLLIRRTPPSQSRQAAAELLERIGLGERLEHRPAELSGGERQRVAIARAAVTRPSCILADEPTGNLDRQTAVNVFELLQQLNSELGTALIFVTHDIDLAQRTQRVLRIEDGELK
ncbi:lipoprotein releasing system ATP-binding protein LolD [Halorhodospira halochloris]|uniref:Lipoprotein-releasing system ATP-binding protein LolD n=1 Tax=Halorhodospira halochloris TaxID=1052 RepID=A0A0X8XAD2_HALHR|nr:lipoprotein-releasing ABC transporter ATP-binding protein LolD [Halorhodospira halochloris]MBK1652057.1 lipoprotein-releasing system ATP-binding protein LolD [Halorhodospira halochloris]BAU57977.1 lipoprotein releasing system ATP-binding protein LolD [Halorhodospira halochloris]